MIGPEASIVRIRRVGGDSTVRVAGLGFAVGERQIVTCAHVVNTALGRPQTTPGDPGRQIVLVEFPLAGSRTDLLVRAATVTTWGPGPEPFALHDLAGLELTEPLPAGCLPATLTGPGGEGRRVQMWGPSPHRPNGGHVTGELLGHVDKGRLHVEQEIRGVFQAAGGFSGGPVWTVGAGQVVGMLVAVGAHGAQTDVYVLSADTLADLWPEVLFRPPPCPYPGLRAFGEDETAAFFGREEFVDGVVAQARTVPVQLIVGPSGAGKSSVLNAGLIPALRASGRTAVVRAQPGPDPGLALAAGFAAAARPAGAGAALPVADIEQWQERLTSQGLAGCGRLLRAAAGADLVVVVVDQIEQSLTGSGEDAGALPGLLRDLVADPAPGVLAVGALRDDYFGQLLGSDPVLGDFVQVNARVLRPMTDDALRRAITEPAQRVTFEDGLVDLLLSDFRSAAATLPLLQFTLQQLWQHQVRGRLTFGAYHAMGGIADALTGYADDVVDRLPAAQQAAVRRIFTALVTPGTQDVGRRLPRSRVRPGDWPVAERLAGDRLLVVRHGAVEVAHEVLLRQWQRLRSWLEQDREFLSWRGGVESAAAGWQDGGHDDDLLLRGRALLRAEDMVAQYPDDTRHLRDYVTRGRAASDRLEQQRLTLYGRAEARRLAAQAELARLDGRVSASLVLGLAVASLERHPTLEGDIALRRALELAPGVLGGHHDGELLSEVDFSPDGTLVACGGTSGRVLVLNAASAEVVTVIPCGAPIQRLLFAGGAALLVVTRDDDQDEEVSLYAVGSGDRITVLGEPAGGTAVAVSRTGHRIAVGSAPRFGPGDVRVYDAEGGELRHFPAPAGDDRPEWAPRDGARDLALSRDGRHLAVAWTRQVELADLADDGPDRLFLPQSADADQVRFNADASLVAFHNDENWWFHAVAGGDVRLVGVDRRWVHQSTFGDYRWNLAVAYGAPEGRAAGGQVQIIDAEDGEIRTEVRSRGQVHAVAFGPRDSWFAAGGADCWVRVYQTHSGRVTAQWDHDDTVYALAVSAGGRVASVGADGWVRLFDPDAGAELRVLTAGDRVRTCDITPDGYVVTGGLRHGVRAWHAATGEPYRRLLDGRTVSFAAVDPSGSRVLAAVAADHLDAHEVVLCDLTTGAEVRELRYGAEVTAVALSPDGSLAAVGFLHADLRLVDLRTGADREIYPNAGRTWSLRFSPDATMLAVTMHGPGVDRSSIQVLDLGAEAAELRFERRQDGIASAVDVSADGTRLAVAGRDGHVRVLDAADGGELHRLDHDSSVSGVRFSPAGDRLVSCCLDGTLRVFDTGTGVEQSRMSHPAGSEAWVNAVAWSPDAAMVASAGDDGTVRLWALGDALIAQGRARITRPPTEPERQRYFSEEPAASSTSD